MLVLSLLSRISRERTHVEFALDAGAFTIDYLDALTTHFGNIALFEEEEVPGDRDRKSVV
jgi:hypothetical protein